MPRYKTSRLISHSPQQVYDMVADVEAYPAFLPLCQAVHIRKRKTTQAKSLLAVEMTMAYKMFCETFVSRAILYPAELRISVDSIDGVFDHLSIRWHFLPLEENPDHCQIAFSVDYKFKNRFFAGMMEAVFDRAFRKYTRAFEARADVLYGGKSD